MSADELPPKSMPHAAAAYTRWANVDPDERVAKMTELSRKAAAKRAAERAAREAAGEVVKRRRRTRSDDALPPIGELLESIQQIQHERADAGLTELSQDALIREAALRHRRELAAATLAALKAERDRGTR